MKCFYCKDKLQKDIEIDVCDKCIFHLDESEYEYDEELQRDIEAVINPRGVTPRRYVE